MASLRSSSHRSLFDADKCSASSSTTTTTILSKRFPQMKINKKLDFDSCSEEDIPRSSSPDQACLRKRLIFDDSEEDFELSDALSSPIKFEDVQADFQPSKAEAPLLELRDFNTSGVESNSDKFSPCRTRSGKIYTSVEKRKEGGLTAIKTVISAPGGGGRSSSSNNNSATKLPTPVFIDRPRTSSRHCSGASAGIATPKSTHIQTSHLRVQEVELNLLQKDFLNGMELDGDGPACNEPPPLISKRPMSRLRLSVGTSLHFNSADDGNSDVESSPWLLQTPANPHSPPTNEVKAMRLFDKSPPMYGSSPIAPHVASRFAHGVKFRHLCGENFADHTRRFSAPIGLRLSFSRQPEAETSGKERKRKRLANINPFTPNSMLESLKKKYRSLPEMNLLGSSHIMDDGNNICDDAESDVNPAKRLRVSDINISRYEEEFVEIKEIASGSFGKVKVARHCLDGMVYAIKVTRNKIYGNTHEERVAMNEVFAHSALMKHKHVVRYYNSWVENGHVYIQNEYCEGGSLANLIKEYKRMGRRFPEGELKRILLHIAKGLQYIHSKQLVHLDVKPENIFIALDHLTPSPISAKSSNDEASAVDAPDQVKRSQNVELRSSVVGRDECSGNESTDSGHASGCDARFYVGGGVGGVDQRISYKIGDLGHVAPIHGDHIPEEGDCRYMAPELLADDADREKLPKADIFSLGLTLYEAASLQELPKNSLEDPMYERIKSGDLPFVEGYSKEFNQLLKLMVSQDVNLRPSASKIVSHQYLRSNSMSKSRAQLYKELKETKAKLRQLELEILSKQEPANWLSKFASRSPVGQKNRTSSPQSSPLSHQETPLSKLSKSTKFLVGRGTPKSNSCLL